MSSIPEEWHYQELNEVIAALDAGASVNAEDRPKSNDEIGVLKVSAVTYGTFDPTTYKVVVDASERARLSIVPLRDTIIVSRANTKSLVGASAYIDQDYPDLFLPDKLWRLTVAEGISARWLSYVLALDQIRAEISDLATGTSASMKNISQEAFLSIPVLLPPLPEQRAIAAILSTWDEAITITTRLSDALKRRKHALMQLLLTGEVRFSEYGEWEELEIGDVAQINQELLSEKANPEEEYFYIDLSAVDQGHIDFPTIKQRFNQLPSRARRVLHKNDVIMATVRPNLMGFALCDFEPLDMICSTGFALISPRLASDAPYIYQSLYTQGVLKQIQDLATGSNYPAINASEVARLRIGFPELPEERGKIGDMLTFCDSEVKLFQGTRSKLTAQKRGLMQQLLTGVVRVQSGD